MDVVMRNKLIIGLIATIGFIGNANAELVYQQGAEIFTQDFQNGLGAGESLSGQFKLFTDANGNTQVGHVGSYINNTVDSYSLKVDLTNWSNVTVSFTASGYTEAGYDFFKLMVREFPQSGWSVKYNNSGVISNATYKFNLFEYSGKVIDLAWVFTSDYSKTFGGVKFDNIVIKGDGYIDNGATNPSIKVPVTLPLLGLMGFGLLGFSRRRAAVPC